MKLNSANNGVALSYYWSSGVSNSPLCGVELLFESRTFDLISFDQKYGTNGHLEFNFTPTFVAHPNPPAQVSDRVPRTGRINTNVNAWRLQAFWVYNDSGRSVQYSIIDDPSTPANPYFRCLNPNGVVGTKSIYPILYVFSPDKLNKFEVRRCGRLARGTRNKINATIIRPGYCYATIE